MKSISLNRPEELAACSEACARALNISRAEYIRRAIVRMNRETQATCRAARMKRASEKVREESMRVNAEFAAVEEDPRT